MDWPFYFDKEPAQYILCTIADVYGPVAITFSFFVQDKISFSDNDIVVSFFAQELFVVISDKHDKEA